MIPGRRSKKIYNKGLEGTRFKRFKSKGLEGTRFRRFIIKVGGYKI